MNKILYPVILFIFLSMPEMSLYAAEKGLPVNTGSLVGRVSDVQSGEKLGWTTLLIQELHRSVAAHDDGTYHFYDIPAGTYTIKTFRVGYRDQSFRISINVNDTTYLAIELEVSPFLAGGMVIQAQKDNSNLKMDKPVVEVSGKKLRQNLGRTIAETIDYEPGLSQRSMGPAPARPVLRGLGGDRLLVLEDGQQTGDLSATSSDHAVTIEPITAERIEIIRGAEALIYGSGAIAGIVNVIRDNVPSNLPHRLTGAMSLQGESANSGYSGSILANVPIGQFAMHLDGSWRGSKDISTPSGTLMNTGISTVNSSLGIGYYNSLGYVGAAATYYQSDYGIPPDPFGGHPRGVDIAMDRKHGEIRAELFPDWNLVNHFEMFYSHSRYYHTEREASGTIGMEFGVITNQISLISRLHNFGRMSNGAIGIWIESRNYDSGGLTFTPATLQNAFAAFLYQELSWDRFSLNGSLRFDARKLDTDSDKLSVTVGQIRDRSLKGWSGAIGSKFMIYEALAGGLNFIHVFRPPTIEELFSEGPHLAAYSYEVGNADLDPEQGNGIEVFADYKTDKTHIHLSVYQNMFDNYIFPANTGQTSWRRADLFVYRFTGQEARFMGFEAISSVQLHENIALNAALNYVDAVLTDSSLYLPQIPPLEGKIGLSSVWDSFNFVAGLRLAAAQNKIGPFEKATNGYAIIDLGAQYTFTQGHFFHTINLRVENLLDTVYRKHLNRIKEVMPEAGRNMRLLYRIYF